MKIGATGDGKSAVATPDGKRPKEEEEESVCNYKCMCVWCEVKFAKNIVAK